MSYLQWTSRVTVSKSGISVAAFDASHLYRASLSVTFTNMVTSADTDWSFTLVTELICKHKQPDINKVICSLCHLFFILLLYYTLYFIYGNSQIVLGPLLSFTLHFQIFASTKLQTVYFFLFILLCVRMIHTRIGY